MTTHTADLLASMLGVDTHEEPIGLGPFDKPLTAREEGRVNRYLATCLARQITAVRIETDTQVSVLAWLNTAPRVA